MSSAKGFGGRRAMAANSDDSQLVFRPERQPKMSEQIARQIVNHIIDNKLPEGTVLPNERQLIEAFDVGRTTLREALRLLETRGVVTIRSGPNGGPVVRIPRAQDLQESLSLILQFSGSSLADVFEARVALEPVTARLGAERLTHEQLDELAQSIERMRDNLDDQAVFLEENARFHGTIADGTGSHILRVFSDTLKSIADGAILGVEYPMRRRASVAAAHERVLIALRQRDPAGAEAAMREHVAEAGDYWRRKYAPLSTNTVRWVH
jgi:DNA-binding FadR family transcriptional regulator